MKLLQQVIDLLSEPPGSVIYHLVTLFALQAVFAISYARSRREQDDEQALRLSVAAGSVFLLRVAFLLVGLLYGSDIARASVYLPPLEQAINTATFVLFIWSLAPPLAAFPRLLDILLLLLLVMTGVTYLFFAQQWQAQVAAGVTYYNGTLQATIWNAIQIIMLVLGGAYVVVNRRSRLTLAPLMVILLLAAHIAQLLLVPEPIPTDTNIPYWVRLGYLVVFPLWVVHAYQRAITPLLATESAEKARLVRFGESLTQAATIIATPREEQRLQESLELVELLLQPAFAAVGLLFGRESTALQFYRKADTDIAGELTRWQMNVEPYPSFRVALSQEQGFQLLPDGVGAKQLRQLYHALQVKLDGPLFLQPIVASGKHVGLLMVAAEEGREQWSSEEHALIQGLGTYLGQALVNSRRLRNRAPLEVSEPQTKSPEEKPPEPSPLLQLQHRLYTVEAERDELATALEEMEMRRRRAEAELAAARQQTRDLAEALHVVQRKLEEAEGKPVPIPTVVKTRVTARKPRDEDSGAS